MFEVLIYNGKTQLLKRATGVEDVLTCVWEFDNTPIVTQMIRDLKQALNEMHRLTGDNFDPWEWVVNVRNLENKFEQERDR